jgi:RsmE family RNA methyltransferase
VERQRAQPLEEVLYNAEHIETSSPAICAIAVGAEGGFTEEEIQSAIAHNFVSVSLGPHILRSETAALTALAISKSWFRRVKIC